MLLPSQRRSAMTLLELLLVMSIILALSSIGYLTADALYGNTRSKAAADMLKGAFAEARARAIEDGRDYRFCVKSGEGSFRIAPDADEYWDGSSTPQTPEGEAPIHIEEDDLPKGVTFNVNNSSGDSWQTIVVFLANGTCSDDNEISFAEGSDAPVVLRIRSMTGTAITVKKKGQGR
jgi:prepilin-type N-terminal cleavage/methylation domain-containing protein